MWGYPCHSDSPKFPPCDARPTAPWTLARQRRNHFRPLFPHGGILRWDIRDIRKKHKTYIFGGIVQQKNGKTIRKLLAFLDMKLIYYIYLAILCSILGWWVHVTQNQRLKSWPPTIGDKEVTTWQGSVYYQPKQCTFIFGKSFKITIYLICIKFDPPK